VHENQEQKKEYFVHSRILNEGGMLIPPFGVIKK